MLTDERIAVRMREAAERIDVDLALADVVAARHGTRSVAPVPRYARRLTLATCTVLGAALALGLVMRIGGEPNHDASAAWTAPRPVPVGAPDPGSAVAHVAAPPAWLGPLVPAHRTGALRSGTWVQAAIARPTLRGYAEPVVVSVFDGTWGFLDEAHEVVLDGRTYIGRESLGFEVLATTGVPAVAVVGRVDRAVLRAVIDAVQVGEADPGGAPSLRLTSLPAGYELIAAPQVLAGDPSVRRTLAESDGRLAINEVSELVDPLLAAAGSGVALEQHEVAGRPAWSGAWDTPTGRATFLVWSPRPGVVFEIDSTDPSRSVAQLVELAERTSVVTSEEWDRLHSG